MPSGLVVFVLTCLLRSLPALSSFGPSCASFAADKEGEIDRDPILSIEGEMMKKST